MSRTIRFKIGRAKNSIVSVLEGNDEKKLNRRKSLTRDHGAPWANVEIPYYNLPDDPRFQDLLLRMNLVSHEQRKLLLLPQPALALILAGPSRA